MTTPGPATASDAILRGFATLRANWPLVPMMALQQVLVLALLVLGAAVPLAALGRGGLGGDGWGALLAWQPAGLAAAAEDLAAAVAPVALPLAMALAGTAVVWTLAVLVFCWFQGGFYGVLLAAERQALPGPPRDWRLFRTWDRALFAGWARRLTGRYFGFWNLWALAALGWLLALLLLVWAAQAAAATWAEAGLLVVGGTGSLALALAFLALAGWGVVAPPDLAREDTSVGRSSRRALALLARRPLAVGLVVGVFVALWLVVAIAVGGLAAPLLLVDFEGRLGLWIAAQAALWLIHLAGAMAVATAMNGALAALVLGDGRQAAAAARAGAGPAARPRFARPAGAAAVLAVVALLAAGCAGRTAPPATPPAPPPAAAAEPVVPAPPLPVDEPAPDPEPPAARPLPEVPLVVRVGLALDLVRLDLPCCGGHLVVVAGDERLPLVAPVTVEPAAGRVDEAVYRLQVAALADGERAAELARRLGERHGLAAEARWDEAAGLHRVRLGRFASREAAEASRRRLEAAGLAGSWVVGEGGGLERPALRLVTGGRSFTAPGRWLRVTAEAGAGVLPAAFGPAGAPFATATVTHAGRRYRGDLLVYLNPRGRLNVINELPLEDYLRGVVPGEMGPEQYGRLEALKAQAVAARTYALRNLGEFREEGYDICATPRCQVYHGLAVEHPLSDRAVAETAGQVLLHHGELVDARYSATCGGHTEDGDVVFPHGHAPYLKGVPCVEAGMAVVEGGGSPLEGEPLPADLARRVAAGEIEERHGAFLDRTGSTLRLRGPGGREEVWPLPADLATFRRRGDGRYATDLALLPGDPITLWLAAGRLVALAQDVDPRELPFDRPQQFASWSRTRSDAELARRVEQRHPGLGLRSLEVVSRGVSGRVAVLRLHGAGGRSVDVEGLAVRWVLDLPDTRFSLERNGSGYVFRGSGWGHGVGMCQVGSFGMAGRGHDYRSILDHYYRDVELVRVRQQAPLWSEPVVVGLGAAR